MRGRKPIPTALKLLRGNPGRRPLSDDEPQYDSLPVECPDALVDVEARAEWSRLVPILARGHVRHVDRAMMIGYCQKWGQWLALEREAAQRPFIVKAGASNYPIQNPALNLANKVYSLLMHTAAEFGLTPSSRSRVHVVATAEPLDEFAAHQRKRRA